MESVVPSITVGNGNCCTQLQYICTYVYNEISSYPEIAVTHDMQSIGNATCFPYIAIHTLSTFYRKCNLLSPNFSTHVKYLKCNFGYPKLHLREILNSDILYLQI